MVWALLAICSRPPERRLVWANVDDITRAGDGYLGSTVAVVGEVGQIFGPGVFTLAADTGDVIVVAGAVTREALRAGDEVEVFGQVRAFSTSDIEAEIGYELDNVSLRAGDPIIVVRQVLSTSRELSLAHHSL